MKRVFNYRMMVVDVEVYRWIQDMMKLFRQVGLVWKSTLMD